MACLSIAFIIGQLGLGGAERQLWLLVRELRRSGHPVSVVTLHPDAGDYWEGPVVATGAFLHKVHQTLPRPLKVLRIASILRSVGPTLVHSWTFHTNFYAAAAGRLAGVPLRLGSERSNEAYSRQVLGPLYPLQLWGLDAIVTNNELAGGLLRRDRPALHVEVVANGVELPDPATFADTRRRLRREWGVPETAVAVGTVGSLLPGKGYGTLLQALSPLLERRPDLFLVIVGDGPLRQELARGAAGLDGRVHLPGSMWPAGDVYSAFDVFCLPTLMEGMPNAVLEASAAGLPVVATAVGGTAELVVDGETGFLVPVEDQAAMRDRIVRLLEDMELRARMGAAGRRRMAELFAVDRMVGRMTALYDGLRSVKRAERVGARR